MSNELSIELKMLRDENSELREAMYQAEQATLEEATKLPVIGFTVVVILIPSILVNILQYTEVICQ